DQVKLYGDAVRWYAELPDPEADERKVRSLRTTAARALAETIGTPAGPVHLNCPFRKPLEPTETDAVPDSFGETLAGKGRTGAFVETERGRPTLEPSSDAVGDLADALAAADRPLIVAGPADPVDLAALEPATVLTLADRVGAPVLADVLSGLRFGEGVADGPVYGGYDVYADLFPEPDVVVRVGASPTSKPLRRALEAADADQYLIDPAGEWREATFTATDLLAATPESTLEGVLERLEGLGKDVGTDDEWLERFDRAERAHWEILEGALEADALEHTPFEGAILATAFAEAPDPATIVVANSMPIRDADRFARPREANLTVLGNRGASGIDGTTSTALGAGSATDDPLVFVTGDLSFYHDSNGLLAVDRCSVDATIVLLDNDGGGIFHKLPIADFEPPFTDQFETPHGLEFDPLAELYGLEFERVEPAAFADAYRRSLEREGTQVLALEFDSAANHRRREELAARLEAAVTTD
ncbi:2-succinyl-5-enolpyruvyl-6-hydroxy-3-cyclohexene-1-carboxylate synthase, partial [Natronococcus sp.]|uniref:2-succinyl-5-enolpyruvyl-6-hydroxy-3- cyclohexene-1-carboxylate synthase n=1 Tax=Natronococcus sp. TaxID=35747 RepID=UPI003A4DA7A6